MFIKTGITHNLEYTLVNYALSELKSGYPGNAINGWYEKCWKKDIQKETILRTFHYKNYCLSLLK